LLNDPVYVEAARALATRIVQEKPAASVDDRLVHAFRLCTARRPTQSEINTLRDLYDEQFRAASEDQAAAKQSLGDAVAPKGISVPGLVAWNAVATTLLNLHETITKE